MTEPRVTQSRTFWSPEADAKLTKLWLESDPQLSTAEIGRRMGMSKNSVVGRAHRLILPNRPSPLPVCDPNKPKRVRNRRRNAASRQTLPPLPHSEATSQTWPQPVCRYREPHKPVSASALGPAQAMPVFQASIPSPAPIPCCWPIGDPGMPGFHFCDAVALPGKSYCLEHHRIAYVCLPEPSESGKRKIA